MRVLPAPLYSSGDDGLDPSELVGAQDAKANLQLHLKLTDLSRLNEPSHLHDLKPVQPFEGLRGLGYRAVNGVFRTVVERGLGGIDLVDDDVGIASASANMPLSYAARRQPWLQPLVCAEMQALSTQEIQRVLPPPGRGETVWRSDVMRSWYSYHILKSFSRNF